MFHGIFSGQQKSADSGLIPTYVGSSSDANESSGTVTLALPGSAVEGDLAIVTLVSNSAPEHIIPSGWTPLTFWSTGQVVRTMCKYLDSADIAASNLAFLMTGINSGALVVFSGAGYPAAGVMDDMDGTSTDSIALSVSGLTNNAILMIYTHTGIPRTITATPSDSAEAVLVELTSANIYKYYDSAPTDPTGNKVLSFNIASPDTRKSVIIKIPPLASPYNIHHYRARDVGSIDSAGANIRDIHWRSNGTTVYSMSESLNRISPHTASTAFDIRTIGNAASTQAYLANPRGFFWKSDGTKLFHLSTTLITEYSGGTAWNVSKTAGTTFDPTTEVTSPESICVSSDGNHVYLADGSDQTVQQYDLSSPWVLSGITAGVSFDCSTEVSQIRSAQVTSDGSRLFVLCSTTYKVYIYNLGIAFDISSAVYSGNFVNVAAAHVSPINMKIADDDSKIWIPDRTSDGRCLEYEAPP